MDSSIAPRLRSVIRAAPAAGSILAVVIGVAVLTGWALDIPVLRSVSPHWATMKANTAACFVVLGMALWLLRHEKRARQRRVLANVCAAVLVLVGLLTTIEYFLPVDFGIDQLLFKHPANEDANVPPGRMALGTALDFLALGLALLGLDRATQRRRAPAQLLSLFVSVNSLLALVGYSYGVKSLYSFAPFSTMAVHTAMLFFVTSAGVLCSRLGMWPLDLITGDRVGSAMARRLLPFAIGLPFVFGWLRLQGERAGFYGFEFGLALFATSNVAIFTALTWLTALSLNRADARRKEAEEETHKINLELEQRISERTAELEAANRAKDQFLTGMSHELRTPLNAIIGFTGTLLMELPGPINPRQRQQLETIRSSGRHQLSLINDLLDLARIASGKIELNFEPINLATVVQEVAETLRPLAEEKGLGLEVNTHGDIVGQSDRRALSQILINLVSNAIKFTERGKVLIDLSGTNGTRTISVTDTGVGIGPDDQARLFQAFSRLDQRGKNRQEGAGLGLHLSQRLAALLGGEITFQSELGKGSVFALSLKGSN